MNRSLSNGFSSDVACRLAIRSAASRWGDNGLSSDVACRVAIKGAALH